ncbi:hypothetical protein [Pasteurella sp. PK-2025]|uniref:hypothetical protein n=1 Tax=unclassified Pasteurella TaxID=2621516 RepID=UPI003C78EB40
MKKFTSIYLAIIVGCTFVGCDNKKSAVAATSPDTTPAQAATVLDANAQFKKDYMAILEWNNVQSVKIREQVNIMQKRLAEQKDPAKKMTPEEVITLVNNLKTTVDQAMNELDRLHIQDPEIKVLAMKIVESNHLAQEGFNASLTVATKSYEEGLKYQETFKHKMQALQKLNIELNELNKKAAEKYRSLLRK